MRAVGTEREYRQLENRYRKNMAGSTSLRDRATAGVAWSALHTWGTHALQLGVMLVLARLLEPRDFGLFAMAQVALVVTHAISDQGIPEALVQANRRDPIAWSTGLLAVLTSSVVCAGILFLVAAPLSGLFRTPDIEPVIRWLAPGVVVYGIQGVFFARIRSDLSFADHAVAGLAGGASSFVVGVPAALAGFGVWALVASAYAGLIVETAVLAWATGRIPLYGFDRAVYRQLVRFGRFIVAGALTTVLNRRSDDYFVAFHLGAVTLGYYAVAYRLLELVTTIFLRAVDRVAFPVFSKLQESPEHLSAAIHTSFRFTSLVAFPAFAGLILVADDLLEVALGPQWIPAATPLRVLALGGIALCATNVLPSAIRAMGFPHWNVAISAAKGILLAAAFAVTARWGLDAVAWTFTAGVYAAFPLFFLAARKLVPLTFKTYMAEGAASFVAAAAMMSGVWLADPIVDLFAPLARLGITVAGGAVLYVLVVVVIAPKQVRELHQRFRRLRRSGNGVPD